MSDEDDMQTADELLRSAFGMPRETGPVSGEFQHTFNGLLAERPCIAGFSWNDECFDHCMTCGWDIGFHAGLQVDGGVMNFHEVCKLDVEFDNETSMLNAATMDAERRWDIVYLETLDKTDGIVRMAYVPASIAFSAVYESFRPKEN